MEPLLDLPCLTQQEEGGGGAGCRGPYPNLKAGYLNPPRRSIRQKLVPFATLVFAAITSVSSNARIVSISNMMLE